MAEKFPSKFLFKKLLKNPFEKKFLLFILLYIMNLLIIKWKNILNEFSLFYFTIIKKLILRKNIKNY